MTRFLIVDVVVVVGPTKDPEGSARESSKTVNTKLLQAVDPDGNPVCLFCNAPVINGFKAGTIEARFCSYTCEEEYRVCIFDVRRDRSNVETLKIPLLENDRNETQ